ncbi:MAG: hypothetical protein ACSHX5_01930 [Phycisphaerales bacterium]
MRYSITPTVRLSVLAALAGSTALLGACSPSRDAELTQSEQLLILEEIDLGASMVGYEHPTQTISTGPSLIAGDWVAIQCAQASGYFNDFNWDGYDWTPVYANVIADQYE